MSDPNHLLLAREKEIRPGLVYPHQDWIIESLLPKREVSLIAGPAGGGKTTLSIDMLGNVKLGNPVFGFATHPCPVVFVVCDRSVYDYHRTMDRLHLPHDTFHHFCQRDSKTTIDTICAAASKQWPECLIYIDGMGTLVPDGKLNDYNVVSDFLREAGAACLTYNVTILGSCHSPKMKEGDKFDNMRQRVLGSTAWGGFTDLMIIVDPDELATEEEKIRKISILPRHAKEFDIKLRFDNGVFTPYEDQQESDSIGLLDLWYKRQPFGVAIPVAVIDDEARRNSISKRTAERWRSEKVDAGLLAKPSRGVYIKPRVS